MTAILDNIAKYTARQLQIVSEILDNIAKYTAHQLQIESNIGQYCYNMLKSREGILLNMVPREFQGQHPEGLQAPRVLGLRTSRGTIFTRIPLRLFQILPFFCNPALLTAILLQPILPLGSIVVNKAKAISAKILELNLKN